MREPKTCFVYIMSNRSKTLYTGVTNNLARRVREYKMGTGSCFAAKVDPACIF
jgi:putative endonuclease